MVSSTRIDLTVDSADGEAVGALGACWDADLSTWFLDPGVELKPFTRWLSEEDRAGPAGLVGTKTEESKGVSLSAFLASVKNVISAGLPEPVWVRAEVRKVQKARSGHVYLELDERDENGLSVASTKGVIWAGRLRSISDKFYRGTGGDLKPDIKVLVRVRADFHPVHGFDLIVEDIDPSFTLGDLLAKLRAIREALQAEGIFGSNRMLPPPAEFVRVAVICPATSAGQGDFRSETDRLQGWGLCGFDYFTATFQGAGTSQSIREAMRSVFDEHHVRPYDALVIIRGGGSVTDLAWLNDLKLARWVCRVPIPVLTGIGHERDTTVLDEVAHRRFDTPSKVALHISHAIRDNALGAIGSLDEITHHVGRILSLQENALDTQRGRLEDQVGHALELAATDARHLAKDVRQAAAHAVRETATALGHAEDRLKEAARGALCDAEVGLTRSVGAVTERTGMRLSLVRADTEGVFREIALTTKGRLDDADCNVDTARDRIGQACHHRINLVGNSLQNALASVGSITEAVLRTARTHLDFNVQKVVGLGPGGTLRRGYAIARDPENRPIGSKEDALRHRNFKVQFRDGDLAVENREYQGEDGR